MAVIKLDYSKVIDRNDINIDIYNNKFTRYDEFISTDNMLSTNSGEFGLMLCDPTIFAYSNMTLAANPLKLYPYQDLIANDDWDRIIFCAANQIGKSFLLDVLAVYRFVQDHGHEYNQAIISKSKDQAKFQMSRIRNMLDSSKFSYKLEKGDQESMNVLTLNIYENKNHTKIKYVNRIIVAPATSSSLGYDLHEIYLDEFGFYEISEGLEHAYTQWFEPRTFATKGRITIFSNPNGKDNYMYHLWNQKDTKGVHRFHRYKFNFLDCPKNTIDEYNELKETRPRHVFESTCAAIFTDSHDSYFTWEEIKKSYDKDLEMKKDFITDKMTFWFLDVGAKQDMSVLVGCYIEPDEHNDRFQHIYIFNIHTYPVGYPLTRVAGTDIDVSDGWHYEKSVVDYLKEYTTDGVQPVFGFDVTGNSGMKALFESMCINAFDITFSGPKKSGMYQRLKYYMEKGLLHRVKSDEFELQLSKLRVKKSVRGYLMIHHESETDHDDVPDAVAGAVHLADNPDIVAPSVTFF